MQCQDMMRRPVQCAKMGETVAVTARTMRDANIGFVPVCDNEGRVRGVVTDRDIAVRVCAADRSPAKTAVEEIMTRDVISCRASDDIAVAELRMREYRKSRMLVLGDDGRAVGVISLSDLAARRDPHAAATLRAISEREVLGQRGKRTPPSHH